MSSSQLCRTAQESAYNLVHPTDIMIASHVARSQYTAEGEINLGTIPVWGVELEHELARKGLRDQQDVYDRRESYKKVRDFLTSEKVLRPDKNGKMDILKPEVINYYANQIDHFLK